LAALRSLPPDSALARVEQGDVWDWTHYAANVAELVDMCTFWLNLEYQKSITDPDDPKVKKAAKRKPPPIPLIAPVAHRPPSVQERYQAAFASLLEQFGSPGEETPIGKRWVTSDEFDALLDL
jgi:hypothetical protein